MGRFFLTAAALLLSFSVPAQTFVVIPFFNETQDSSSGWIGESIAESVSDSLAGEGLLTVDRLDRGEVERRLGVKPGVPLTRATVMKIAMDLDASHVVFGRYEVAGRGVKTTATILDVKKLASLAELSETEDLAKLSRLQGRLAWRVMNTLFPLAPPDRTAFLARHPPLKTEALEAYVRGLTAGREEIRIHEFMQAAKLDADYAAPAFELGSLHFAKSQWQEATLWFSRIHSNDAHYRRATFFLGLARYHLGDFSAAKEAFLRVSEKLPLNEVFNNLGAAQSRLNENESLQSFEQALGGAESDPDYHFNAGYALLRRGRNAEAAERFRAALERNPPDAESTQMLGRAIRPDSASAVPEGRERLKTEFPEAAFLQLKAVLSPVRPK